MSSKSDTALKQLKSVTDFRSSVLDELGKVVIGQTQTLDILLASLLAGGHCLLIGVPGLAKTLMVSGLAAVCGGEFNRIQFTPDLMPSDITGSEILEGSSGKKAFRFVKGPVFSNILLADEINRTPPKTQAALLQSMQEHQVTVNGKTYPLPAPFFVLATQNPIEQEGTYPLPEAQLDRFMFSVRLEYPSYEEELEIVSPSGRPDPHQLKRKITATAIIRMQRFLKDIYPVADNIKEAAVKIVRQSRPETTSLETVSRYVAWGAGPRAGAFLLQGTSALAALRGKPAADLQDLTDCAFPVLAHRLILNYAGEAEGMTPDSIIQEILNTL